MESFKKLGISQELLRSIEEAGFKEPSDIQKKTIPLVLAGKDVIGGSATGSGKTLAFGAAIIDKIKKGNGIKSLILTPTRELAEQVCKTLQYFSKFKGLNVISVYGGVDIKPQERAINRADVLVGTPGRILDHLDRRSLKLDNVKILVLDEADRMLDMGFIEDVLKIISYCPIERQTLLFSATISPDIEHLVRKHMKSPVMVEVESYVDPSLLEQVYYDVRPDMKFSLLVHLLKQEHSGLVMIFCNTRNNADFIAKNLNRYGIEAVAIHGGLNQNRRTKIMEHFHNKKVYVLICTDVAARGLDIKGVSHVYNYDSPGTSKEYIHRVGRTARAGKEGKAISLVAQRDYENFARVVENKEYNIQRMELPEFEKIFVKFDMQGGKGFSGSRRGSGRGFRRERSYTGGRSGGRGFDGGGSRFGSSGRFGNRNSEKSAGRRSSRSFGRSPLRRY